VVGQAKPGVVPGFDVLRAGVAEPNDGAQRSGFRLGLPFALALGLGLRLPDELRLGGRNLLDDGGSLLGPGRHHGADRRVRVVEDLGLRDADVADEE
jgi:hypothetical protein